MKKQRVVDSPRRARWSKWLKFWGAAVLLAAFALQMRQTQQSSLEAERTQAAELDGRANMRALEYRNLYLSGKAIGLDDPSNLQGAALQYYEGRFAMMVTSPADKGQTSAKLNELKVVADKVTDLASFNHFMLVY
jgi:hypothetical protein